MLNTNPTKWDHVTLYSNSIATIKFNPYCNPVVPALRKYPDVSRGDCWEQLIFHSTPIVDVPLENMPSIVVSKRGPIIAVL